LYAYHFRQKTLSFSERFNEPNYLLPILCDREKKRKGDRFIYSAIATAENKSVPFSICGLSPIISTRSAIKVGSSGFA